MKSSRVIVSESQIRITIRKILENIFLSNEKNYSKIRLLESSSKYSESYLSLVKTAFDTFKLSSESLGIKYDAFWMTAAAMQYVDKKNESFAYCLFSSITAGGISQYQRTYTKWYIKPPDKTLRTIRRQIELRRKLIEDIRPEVLNTFIDISDGFLTGTGNVMQFSSEELEKLYAILEYIGSKGVLDYVKGSIGATLRAFVPASVFVYPAARELLADKNSLGMFLGKTVLLMPPKSYDELTDEEKSAFDGVKVKSKDSATGKEVQASLAEDDLFKQWSKVPEAEIIAINIEGTQPVGFAYVFETVTESLDEIKTQNLQVATWNEAFSPTISFSSPPISLRPARFEDIFDVNSAGEASLKTSWRFDAGIKSGLSEFKKVIEQYLSDSSQEDDNSAFASHRLVIVDLRCVLPPNKVYSLEGKKSASMFECPAESTIETIDLAFAEFNPLKDADINEEIGIACRIAVADSLAVNLTITALQIIQTIAADIVSVLGPEAAIPARLTNSFLIIFENYTTQIAPLLYAVAYFAKRGKIKIASIIMTRVVVLYMMTAIQAAFPEGALLGKAATFRTIFAPKAIVDKIKVNEIAANIASLIIDVTMSYAQTKLLNPADKTNILNFVKSQFSGVSDDYDSLESFEQRLGGQISDDILGINKLYAAIEKLRITRK